MSEFFCEMLTSLQYKCINNFRTRRSADSDVRKALLYSNPSRIDIVINLGYGIDIVIILEYGIDSDKSKSQFFSYNE
jgi:hypothetical protein